MKPPMAPTMSITRHGSTRAVDTRNCASTGFSSRKSSVPLRTCSTTLVRLGLMAPSSTHFISEKQPTTTSASGKVQPRTVARCWKANSLARAPPWPSHRAHAAGLAAAGKEDVAAVGLEAADHGPLGHGQPLQHLAGLRVDAADVRGAPFPGSVPQLAVDPGHARDESVRLDGAQDGAAVGIDQVDLPRRVLPDEAGPLGPRQPRILSPAR